MNLLRNIMSKSSYSLKKLGCLLFASVLISSCSHHSDDVLPPEVQENLEYFLSLVVNVPESKPTRSTTLDDGTSSDRTLEGVTNENIISSAYLFFFEGESDDPEENEFVCEFIAGQTSVKGNESPYSVVAKLEEENLLALAGKTLHLYVVANTSLPINYLIFDKESEFLNATFNESTYGTTFNKPFGSDRNGKLVPMTNAAYYIIDLSKITGDTQDEILSVFHKLFKDPDPESYLDLEDGKVWKASDANALTDENGKEIYKGNGDLELERSVARIDYGDIRSEADRKGCEKNVFELKGAKETTYLRVVSMELFNMGKQEYLFRHTATGTKTLATGDVEPFKHENAGDEYSYTWIADSDWGSKKKDSGADALSFFNQMTKQVTESDVATGNGEEDGETDDSDATENTEEKIIWDYTGDCDGAKILAPESEWLRSVGGKLYAPWHYVMENTVPSTELMTLENTTGIRFHMLVCDKNGDAITVEDNGNLRVTMADGTYQEIEHLPESEIEEPAGYYLDYRYLIEHNNVESGTVDGNSGNKNKDDMAPMQIGIVRNNVYQMSINSISNLPQPHEPDNFYMAVEVRVLSWKKVNNDEVSLGK